jgi:hypothetical protein
MYGPDYKSLLVSQEVPLSHAFTDLPFCSRENYDYDGSSESRGSIDPVTKGKLAEGVEPVLDFGLRSKIQTYASRPAIEVLKDYTNRFRTLEWIPGYDDHRNEV